ncbi:hypothetical protein AKJ58_01610 [candidate division MSBL1 archaeon SCGC-AAA385D11]|uniref:Uncharacterized protein n=1 Tax=candidate division MSBL1 archaeon SCGC-AAA385D11 TaxID=1698286 RepID=A0A133VN71_9EURY|nr:hypothetical protein AKJ58_01610 [candidate division MSBL1 archaeon SCGC-AAA385D11]
MLCLTLFEKTTSIVNLYLLSHKYFLMPISKDFHDYFSEYSYRMDDPEYRRIYEKMWDDGYKLGEYGKALENFESLSTEKLFSILLDIGKWKAGERWYKKGYDEYWNHETIKRVLDVITSENSDRERIKAFGWGIKGFNKRTGSAVLTVVYPDQYGILDYKVWRALNHRWSREYDLDIECEQKNKGKCPGCYESNRCRYKLGASNSKPFNLAECDQYFDGIRTIGRGENMNPRQVDMALWEYDSQKSSCFK